MTDATHRIKNLAIALRATHRSSHKLLADRIYVLLQKELTKAEKEASLRQRADAAAAENNL